ncbi:MAG: dockerin type I repeat-containing protein, partial [Ruminococcus sp.]|nr:dockerin type I repeat-containing protein [Ruminococcus sp.]
PVDNSELFHDDGTFYIHAYDSKYGDGADLLIRWIITNDDVLTINLAEQHFAISDVKEVIGAEYVEEQDKGYAWFIRNDGSIWRYCFETQESVRMSEESTQTIVSGDANGDGAFNISDAVTLQNWLLSVSDTELINWKAVDLNDDGEINVFDLCMMKRMLCDTQK